MTQFWYKFLDNGSGKLGFQVVCNEAYIAAVADRIDFRVVNEDVSELVDEEGKPLELVCEEHSSKKGFLWSIHPETARYGLDYCRDNMNCDEGEIVYATHNCDSRSQRVGLERAFLAWTSLVDANHGL